MTKAELQYFISSLVCGTTFKANFNYVTEGNGHVKTLFSCLFLRFIFSKICTFFTGRKCPYSEFSGPYFPGPNADISRVNICNPSEYGKIRTKKTPNADTFYEVLVFHLFKDLDSSVSGLIKYFSGERSKFCWKCH